MGLFRTGLTSEPRNDCRVLNAPSTRTSAILNGESMLRLTWGVERESEHFSNATHEFRKTEKVGLVLSAQNAFSAGSLPLQDLVEVGIRFAVPRCS